MNLKRTAAAAAVAMIGLGSLTACNVDSSCTQSAIEAPQRGGGGGHGGEGTGAHGSDEGSVAGTGSRSGSFPFFPFFGAHSGSQCTSPTAKP